MGKSKLNHSVDKYKNADMFIETRYQPTLMGHGLTTIKGKDVAYRSFPYTINDLTRIFHASRNWISKNAQPHLHYVYISMSNPKVREAFFDGEEVDEINNRSTVFFDYLDVESFFLDNFIPSVKSAFINPEIVFKNPKDIEGMLKRVTNTQNADIFLMQLRKALGRSKKKNKKKIPDDVKEIKEKILDECIYKESQDLIKSSVFVKGTAKLSDYPDVEIGKSILKEIPLTEIKNSKSINKYPTLANREIIKKAMVKLTFSPDGKKSKQNRSKTLYWQPKYKTDYPVTSEFFAVRSSDWSEYKQIYKQKKKKEAEDKKISLW